MDFLSNLYVAYNKKYQNENMQVHHCKYSLLSYLSVHVMVFFQNILFKSWWQFKVFLNLMIFLIIYVT